MALITNSAYLDFLAILVTIAIGVVTFFKWRFKHWHRLGVPYIRPTIPFGTLSNILWSPKSFGVTLREQYEESKMNGYKHVGLFSLNVPMYMPIDLGIIKSIMSKDFNHFTDRGFYFNEKDDPLSAHLFALEGERWRSLRAKLTPIFTSGKMKMMFETQAECGEELVRAMKDACAKRQSINMKHYAGCFTIDVIGACVFGINCNSFKNPDTDFLKHSKKIFAQTTLNMLKAFFAFSNRSLARFLGVAIIPKDSAKFFMDLIKDIVGYRERTNEVRKDFLQILVELKNGAGCGDNHLSIEELAAQSVLFFLAGYETSSSTISVALYELAKNPELQERSREEVDAVLASHGGRLTYEAVKEMTYLNQVVEEVLRKYPPLPMLNRKCVADYKVPNNDLIIKKGTYVVISSYGLQYDAEYFPEPEKFDPDRFDPKTKNVVPFSYMPFGEGPRLCIGTRFGLMQTLVGLSLLLQNFRFSPSTKMKTPLSIEPLTLVLTVVGDIWLEVEKL